MSLSRKRKARKGTRMTLLSGKRIPLDRPPHPFWQELVQPPAPTSRKVRPWVDALAASIPQPEREVEHEFSGSNRAARRRTRQVAFGAYSKELALSLGEARTRRLDVKRQRREAEARKRALAAAQRAA